MPAKDEKITTIIFDFDGVLSHDNTDEALKKHLPPDEAASAHSKLIASRYLYDCMVGAISFNEFKLKFAEMSGISSALIDEVAKDMIDSRSLDQTVLNLTKRLKDEGFSLVLHSDMMKVPFDSWTRRFLLKDIFDHLICSAHIGSLKNNPETYDKILKFLGVAPQEVIYVDDSSANIYTAKSKGIEGVVFIDTESLLKELGRRGLILF